MELKIDGILVLMNKKTFNGYLDWDGCPDVLAAESTEPTRYDSDGDGLL